MCNFVSIELGTPGLQTLCIREVGLRGRELLLSREGSGAVAELFSGLLLVGRRPCPVVRQQHFRRKSKRIMVAEVLAALGK